jgi:hypothetical protein
MARQQSILAICLALLLVVLPLSTVWAINSTTQNPSVWGSMPTDGGGDSGHPWDDGTNGTPIPGDSTLLPNPKTASPPVIIPTFVPGGNRWASYVLVSLWQSVSHAKISPKVHYRRPK